MGRRNRLISARLQSRQRIEPVATDADYKLGWAAGSAISTSRDLWWRRSIRNSLPLDQPSQKVPRSKDHEDHCSAIFKKRAAAERRSGIVDVNIANPPFSVHVAGPVRVPGMKYSRLDSAWESCLNKKIPEHLRMIGPDIRHEASVLIHTGIS